MASYMNAADVVSTAVEIETRGHAFYESIAKQASGEDQTFFTEMAQEELKHKTLFSAMLTRIGGANIPAGASDDEYQEYLYDLINSHSLFLESQQQAALVDPYVRAMQFEKDTILFFYAMLPLVPESERKVIQDCANEEKRHLRRIVVMQKKKKQ